MKFSVSKDDLENAVTRAFLCVAKLTTIPVLSNFHIKADGETLTIRATNLNVENEIVMPAQVDEPGETSVEARRLKDTLSNLDSDRVSFTRTDERSIQMRSGRSRFKMQTLSTEGFPRLDNDKGNLRKLSIPAKELINKIDAVAYAAGKNHSSQYFNGVSLKIEGEILSLAGSDGHRLSMFSESNEAFSLVEDTDLIIPIESIGALKIMLHSSVNASIHYTDNHITVTGESDTFTSKLINIKSPNYAAAIPSEFTNKITVNRMDLMNSISRVSPYAVTYSGISLEFVSGELKVSAIDKQSGAASDFIDAASDVETEVALNGTYLTSMLRATKDENVILNFNGPGTPVVIESGNSVHVISAVTI